MAHERVVSPLWQIGDSAIHRDSNDARRNCGVIDTQLLARKFVAASSLACAAG